MHERARAHDAETATKLEERIREAKEKFVAIADMEEETFQFLAENIPKPESLPELS